MMKHLEDSVYLFSGAKTSVELREMAALLVKDGQMQPFSSFWKEVQTIHNNYNKTYLEAEYIFATQSAQMASKWNEFEKDGERYNLQYRTAGDERVRESHMVLHDTTLPPSDPFWEKYFPPNGWRCRCTTVQVRKSKYPESESEQSQNLGEKATDGRNNIFRFNSGKQEIIFPKHHPYFKSLDKETEDVIRQLIDENSNRILNVETAEDVVNVISERSSDLNWFQIEGGFKELLLETNPNNNGSTDRDGKIWLNRNIMNDTISGINKLLKDQSVTQSEAGSLGTFWHEITHNRNTGTRGRLSTKQRRFMELSNEFVARNTLTDFYNVFDSELQFPEFTRNRTSTGYNTMVRNYSKIIEKTGLDLSNVVDKVKDGLFNKEYSTQKNVLIKSLEGAKKTNGNAITKAELRRLVTDAESYWERRFEELLNDAIR